MKFQSTFEKQILYGYLKKMWGGIVWSCILFRESVRARAGCTGFFGKCVLSKSIFNLPGVLQFCR